LLVVVELVQAAVELVVLWLLHVIHYLAVQSLLQSELVEQLQQQFQALMVLILYLVQQHLLLLKAVVVLVVQTLVHTKVKVVALEAEAVMMVLQLLAELLQQIMDVLELDFLVVLVTTLQVVAVEVLEAAVEKEDLLDLVEHLYL
jgi:hypothetical protein